MIDLQHIHEGLNEKRGEKMSRETIREFLLKGEKEELFLISDIANQGGSDTNFQSSTHLFYEKHKKEIWKIIDRNGGLLKVLENDNDQQYIEDDETFKCVLSWLAVEFVAQKIINKRARA